MSMFFVIYLNLLMHIFGTTPDSFLDWKREWFYVYLEGDDWDNFFRPNFSKSIDGSLWDLKLGIADDTTIQTLVRDNLHQCAIFNL